MTRQIILASTSPRRKQLLEQIGLKFDVVPSSYEEDMTQDLAPVDLVKVLAQGKAVEVAAKYPEAIVIGADTFITYENHKLGKPKDADDAAAMLQMLSGKAHEVLTGVAVICKATSQEFIAAHISKVFMTDITDEQIQAYVAGGEPLDKAGAYGIQGEGAKFVHHIEGDYSSIMGLPLNTVWQLLQKIN